tara:strand:+ start:249 stop:461 length:213 start_codon:yes stop_codon:yes gene_type:complete
MIGCGGTNNKHQNMDVLPVYGTVASTLCILKEMALIGNPHMKPRDYIALHILNCIICAVTIGVLYNIYFG